MINKSVKKLRLYNFYFSGANIYRMMRELKLCTLALLFIVIVILALLAVAVTTCTGMSDENSEVIPPNPTGFIGSWHPAPECVQCHVSLLPESRLRSMVSSCVCHGKEYVTGGAIDNEKIRTKAHGIQACIDCHIGTGIAKAGEISANEIHRVHLNVDCRGCHEAGKNLRIPESGDCNSCHQGGVHSIHGNRTGELCVACHGSFGIKYKEKGYKMKEGVPVIKSEEEKRYPTILNMLKALLKFIEGGKK